jgi:sugar/nucleoside kinase (ribokinase family)
MAGNGYNPVEYLVIGHVSKDLTTEGPVLGGTAAYAGRTAQALGLRVGVVTSVGPDLDLSQLDNLEIVQIPAPNSTTFENFSTPAGRRQILHNRAAPLDLASLPISWLRSPIIHLGPIADEVNPTILDSAQEALVCVTPQGWLRKWDADGVVSLSDWDRLSEILPKANAVIISLEDLQGSVHAAREMATICNILVLTKGDEGAHVFWGDQERNYPGIHVNELDPTGAGDIFAAAFFIRLHQTQDPWEAARMANTLAASSVTRAGLDSIPTAEEVRSHQTETTP